MTRTGRFYLSAVFLCLVGLLAGIGSGSKAAKIVFIALLGALSFLGVCWLVVKIFQRLLWRVGRRLAFSYFLIGIVPIPLLALLFMVIGAVVAGFVSGQSYRSAVRRVHAEVRSAATARLASTKGQPSVESTEEATFAVYRDGILVGGDPRAPQAWPTWLETANGTDGDDFDLEGPPASARAALEVTSVAVADRTAGTDRDRAGAAETTSRAGASAADEPAGAERRGDAKSWQQSEPQSDRLPPLLLLEGGEVTLACARRSGRYGVIALAAGDLEQQLRRRSGVWVRLTRGVRSNGDGTIDFSIGERRFQVSGLRAPGSGSEEGGEVEDFDSAERFYGYGKTSPMATYPSVAWGDLSAPLRHVADGQADDRPVVAVMRISPQAVRGLLFSGNAELRTSIWAALITLTALLFDIYLISLLVASFMAFGLSRAVNRLSAATERIAKGDFSVRIPVRRKDQIGALQRDFNHMTEHLEELVQTAAQKEALESELQTARRLQTSLLPHRLDVDPRVEIAAFFEPSAAIGGDYYDVVCLPGDRLAIFVADVSGHGLPAGLRMAMIKAGVNLLAGQGLEPSALLAKLDGLVRSAASGEAAGDDGGRRKRRDFVTASLALLDLASGDLELTNAGHPPLYVARAGAVVAVDEIALPGSALGGLGTNYGSERVRLTSGDCAIWLSDGLIEACNDHLEAFGYDRVRAALATGTTAGGKIAALLAAVRAHTGGREVEDDRTVVALRFL